VYTKKDLEKIYLNQKEEIKMLYEVLNHYDIKLVQQDIITSERLPGRVKRFLFMNKRGKEIAGIYRIRE
jgi:hypothetical protein